jgi:hypothetical protein
MSAPSDSPPDPEPDDDPALVAELERWLVLAPHVGVDPEAMAYVARRLAAHEAERADTLPSRRREQLDALIAKDVETLCLAFVRLRKIVARMPKA